MANGSAWASSKSGDIVAVLKQEDIDAFNEKPQKKSGKAVIEAYIRGYLGWSTNGRYQAAAKPVDLEELKVAEEDEVMEDVEDEDEDEEEEEDAALEDVKDLYEEEGDEEGAGKKRKRSATDDGEQKPKKKVLHPNSSFHSTGPDL